jgi:hypothetical protein
MTSTGDCSDGHLSGIGSRPAFVLTLVTRPMVILRSSSQTLVRTPGDAVVVNQRVAQQASCGERTRQRATTFSILLRACV